MSWYCGSHETSAIAAPGRPAREHALAHFIAATLARSARVVTTTPLGSPVEPEVNCRKQTSAAAAAGVAA